MKKSIITGVALGAFALSAGLSLTTNVHAKTYATIATISKSKKVSGDYVNFTGKNALYTKAGTMRGAKLVKSTSQLKTLAKSTRGLDSFMILRTATTNQHNVYLKIRSLDGKTTGWIYDGKSTQPKVGNIIYKDKAHKTPAGGVSAFETSTTSPLTQTEKTSYYRLATPGSATDGTGVLYSTTLDTASPAWGTLKVAQPDQTTSAPYANDVFIVTLAKTRTRQGDRWLKVIDLNNTAVQGYIKASAMTKLPAATAKTGITVNYVDNTSNKVVGTTIVPASGTTAMNLAIFGYFEGLPAGYTANADHTNGTTGFTDKAAAQHAVAGDVLTYQVGVGQN